MNETHKPKQCEVILDMVAYLSHASGNLLEDSKKGTMFTDIFKHGLKVKFAQFEHYTPDLFVKSQWQKSNKISIYYLCYRWCVAYLFLTIFLISLFEIGDPNRRGFKYKWPIYLTNWGIFLCTLQAMFGALLVTDFYRWSKKADVTDILPMRKSYTIYWILHSTSAVIAFGVTCVYWYTVYDPVIHQLDAGNLSVHAFNSVIMLVDLIIVAHPFRFVHCFYSVAFTLIYIVFNFIYYLFGGTNRNGCIYVYKILNWTQPTKAIIAIIFGVVFLILLHTCVWFLTILKRNTYFFLKRKLKSESCNVDGNDLDTIENVRQTCILSLDVV